MPNQSTPEKILTAIFADALLTGVNKAIGEREKAGHVAPPRLVAVPRGAPGELRQPDRPGDRKDTDVGRILLLRDFVIEWQCHNVDWYSAEQLFINAVTAIRNYAHHSVTFSEETWLEQQEGEDSFDRWGSTISFVSTIAIPLYEARGQLVTLTATPKIDTTVNLPTNGTFESVTISED